MTPGEPRRDSDPTAEKDRLNSLNSLNSLKSALAAQVQLDRAIGHEGSSRAIDKPVKQYVPPRPTKARRLRFRISRRLG